MNLINNNEVNNIYEWNLLRDILNTSKITKNINIHYSTILHVYLNTHKGGEILKIFRILLDSVYSSTILMIRLTSKLNP